MSKKILVADDSPTIQKVIAITLSNESFELDEARSYDDLIKKLTDNQYNLLLLDFSLSETVSGYDIAAKVQEFGSGIKTIVMLGTFDSFDDSSIKEGSISEKIIKPFESSNFIEICKSVLGGEDSFESSFSDDQEGTDQFDDWSIDSKGVETESENSAESQDDKTDQTDGLASEGPDALNMALSGWGIEVPAKISEPSSSDALLPPKISADDNIERLKVVENETQEEEIEAVIPKDEDLGFPEVLESNDEEEREKPQFLSAGILSDDEEEEEDLEKTDPALQLETKTEVDENLENDVADELGAEDFWAVDEVNERPTSSSEMGSLHENDDDVEEEAEDEEVTAAVQETIDSSVVNEPTSQDNDFVATSINTDEIVAKLKEEIVPIIENIVKEMSSSIIERVVRETSGDIIKGHVESHCPDEIKKHVGETSSSYIEKIAWEVIPDLAENLVEREIKEISSSLES